MSADYFQVVAQRLSVMAEELKLLQENADKLAEQATRQDSRVAEIEEWRVRLTNKEKEIIDRESRLSVIRDEARTVKQEAEFKQNRLNETLEEMSKKDKAIADNLNKFDNLQAQASTLKLREQDIASHEKDLAEREALIEKEKRIDRDRKELLDSLQKKLDSEKVRLQKIAER